MKKIAIVINNFKMGGAERVAAIIANQLCERNEVHAIIGDDEINYPIDNQVNIHVLYGKESSKFLKIPVKLIQLYKLIKNIKPDIILAFGNSSAMYGAFCKFTLKNNIILISSERTDPTREPANPLMITIRNWAYNKSDYLVCQTDWVKNYFERKKFKVKCVVIPNPVSSNIPSWLGINSEYIMTACRLEPQKNLPLLLHAFKKFSTHYPHFRLKIFGEGYLRNRIENLIHKLELESVVDMPGFSNNIYNEMTRARMYVSSSDYEGISNSMLEALCCGLPVIHTDCPVGGASMFIKDGVNGLLVPVGDVEKLYKAMLKLVGDKKLSKQISSQSVLIKEDLSVDHISNRWMELVKEGK